MNKRKMWAAAVALAGLVGNISSVLADTCDASAPFPYMQANTGPFSGVQCITRSASVTLPPGCQVDYSRPASHQGFEIRVIQANSPGGGQVQTPSLNTTTNRLTVTSKVCSKNNQRGWYEAQLFLYGKEKTPPLVNLTVAKTGSGAITSTPAGISCGTDCVEGYTPNTQVTLTATAASGFTFKGWSGSCSGTASTVTLAMDVSKNCTATFEQAVKKGVTWQKTLPHDSINGIERVGCYYCDAYVGDTDCTTELPVLCIKQDGSPRPNYANVGTAHAMSVEFYNGWAGGHIATTLPVKGTSLTSAAVADATCATAFGEGWRMAQHGDGRYVSGMSLNNFYGTAPLSPSPWPAANSLLSGGWGFFAYGNVIPNSKFWVRVVDQPSACWD